MDETGAGDETGGDETGHDETGNGEADGSDPFGEPGASAGPLEDLAGEDEFYEYPDEEPYGEGEPHTALPGKVESWRRRSATGAILTGFALGLQEVFEPKRDEPAVIMETSGEPPKDLPVEADFEYGRPRQSVVNVRPWLLPGAAEESASEQSPEGESGEGGNHPEGGEPGS